MPGYPIPSLWFIKTKRRRVFDAGGASLEGSALHGVVFDRSGRPAAEEQLLCTVLHQCGERHVGSFEVPAQHENVPVLTVQGPHNRRRLGRRKTLLTHLLYQDDLIHVSETWGSASKRAVLYYVQETGQKAIPLVVRKAPQPFANEESL